MEAQKNDNARVSHFWPLSLFQTEIYTVFCSKTGSEDDEKFQIQYSQIHLIQILLIRNTGSDPIVMLISTGPKV